MCIEIRPPSGLVPLLMTLPLLHALRQGNPDTRLVVAVEETHHPLLALTGLDLEPAARRGRWCAEARRLDLRTLPDIRSRSVNGLKGRPLWRAFLAAALDAGLVCRGLPRPPYLKPEPSLESCNGGRPSVVVRDPAWFPIDPFSTVTLWLQRQGEPVEWLDFEPHFLADLPRAVRHLAGRRLLLSSDTTLTCLAAALGVPVLGVSTMAESPRCHQPFLSPHVILVLPSRSAPVPEDDARQAAAELLAKGHRAEGRFMVVS